jgi:hypothetical protein
MTVGRIIRRMITTRFHALAAVVGMLAFATVHAGDFEFDAFTLAVPDGYQGPQTTSPMQNVQVHAFTVDAAPVPKPVMMILMRRMDAPADAPALKPEESLAVSKKLAGDMLRGTERRRTDFKAMEPREIQIAGQPAVDIEWTGKVNDIDTGGRLFVMIHQTTAYFFQVMGAAPPTKDMVAAIDAVKGLRKKP